MSEPETLLDRLGAPERDVQRRACDEALARMRADPRFGDELRRLLREGPALARFGAAFTLFREGGRVGLALLPALLDSLDLADGDLRWEATHMLVVLGRMHGEVLPVLIDTARTAPSPIRRRMAFYALRELAPERDETRDAMIAGLDDGSAEVRHAALSSISKLHEPGPELRDRVLELLSSSPDVRARRIAAVLLPGLVSPSLARAALERAAADGDPALARAAALALRRLVGVDGR
jgi:HEAT repeat protein